MSGTSAKKHGGSELCSILNRALREDDPITTVHAAVFANAINIVLMGDEVEIPQSWLEQLFKKKSKPAYLFVMDVMLCATFDNTCMCVVDSIL